MNSLIERQNPHWKGTFQNVPLMRRDVFNTVLQDLDKDLMSLISGPRRTGKSVLLKQIMYFLIQEKGVHPKQVLFFEFSPESDQNDIDEVFNTFITEVANQNERKYIFFDELQYIKGYESVLKLIYDLNKSKTKIFITGSLSISYKKRMHESLAGRFFEYKVFPLFFEEFLKLTSNPEYTNYIKAKESLFQDTLLSAGVAERLRYAFEEFLMYKRLPETCSYNDNEKCALYNKGVLEQSLSQDALSYFSIGLPRIFNALFHKIALKNGSEISVKNLSENTLSVGMATLSSYLDVLEVMGLLYVVRNTIDPLRALNASKKIYVSSHFSGTETDTGHLVESYVLERLLSLGNKVTYYRKRGDEIDFLIPSNKTAMEIKFVNKLEIHKLKVLSSFCTSKSYSSKIVSLGTVSNKPGQSVVPAVFI